MSDVIITGASRGIGRALALALANPARPSMRLVLVARDEERLGEVARQAEASGASALVVPGDLSTIEGARALGERLADACRPGAILVQNAGLWPARRELTSDGLEAAFAVNFVGPLVLQDVLLARGKLARIMLVSAGLIALGRYSAGRTPTGLDFSSWRTYCTTKLAFAVAQRDIAARHPEIDFVVLHPGVVATELGARTGIFGALVQWAKRFQERPEVCAARLKSVLEQDRWSPPGEARWMHEDQDRPWPRRADDEETRGAIRHAVKRYLPGIGERQTQGS